MYIFDSKKVQFFLIAIILLVGFLLRSQNLFSNSFAFTYDVGRDLLALRDIVASHRLALIGPTSGLHGLFYGPWWYYVLLPFFFISNGDPRGVLSFIILIGLLTSLLSFYLGKKISGPFLGLLLCCIISFSSELIGLSSQIWSPYVAPLGVVMIFLLLEKIHFKKSKSNLTMLLLGFSLALLIDFEIVFGLLFFLSFLFLFLIFLKKDFRKQSICSFLFGVLIAELPKIFFEIRHSFLMTKTIFAIFRNPSSNTVFSLNFDFFNRLKIFFDQWSNTVGQHNYYISFVFLFLSVVIVQSYFKKMSEKEKFFLLTSITVIITFFLGFTFFSQAIWSHYLVGLPIIYGMILSLCLLTLYKNFPNKRISIIVVFFILVVILAPNKIINDLHNPAFESDPSVYKDQLLVTNYIYSAAQGNNFKYILYTPPVHDYTYQYLFNWYGKKKYGYVPIKQSQLFFVILEPDNQNPQRLADWLKQRQNDGVVISEKKFPGNIVVQIRKTQ